MSLAMTKSEREAFLADVHVGLIAIEQKDGPPVAVPVWYDYAPDVGVWLITGEQSAKGKALAAAQRFTLCAQTEDPPYRYVSVEGPVVEVRQASIDADTRAMAHRYLGLEMGDAYVKSQGSGGSVYTMRPERWRTVDYRKLG